MSTQHLTGEQVSRWAAGERPANVAAHLKACADCHAEVTRFEGLLTGFHNAAQALPIPRVPVFAPPRTKWQLQPRWVLATALAVVLAAVPFYKSTQPPAPAPTEVAEVTDAQLLEQINAQLTRHVPGPLEPLEALGSTSFGEFTQGKNQ